MIRELSVSGLGGLEPTTIELHPGLTVITGETGTGKTMLLRALGLALGAKGDPGWVSHLADQARIDCVMSVAGAPLLRGQLLELGVELDEDEVISSRTLGARSRVVLGGRPLPLATVASVFSDFITVQGQHDQRELAQSTRQRSILDRHAGGDHLDDVNRVSAIFDQLRQLRADLVKLQDADGLALKQQQQAQALLADVAQTVPLPGEVESLKKEAAGLAEALAHRDALAAALNALDDKDDQLGAVSLLTSAIRELSRVPGEHPMIVDVVETMRSSQTDMNDAMRILRTLVDSDEDLSARLEAVLARQRDIASLLRRHACRDLQELFDRVGDAQALVTTVSVEDQLLRTHAEIDGCERNFDAIASRLFAARVRAAGELGESVNQRLTRLGLSHMRFNIRVEATSAHRLGADEVLFELSASDGERSMALARGASGGEMSRVALAMEAALCAAGPVASVIFDEVDAGVGGVTAHAVGESLADLSQHSQVILVTHLPQVAAFADMHIVVERQPSGVVVRTLNDDDRIVELARMLGDADGRVSARSLALELVAHARQTRACAQ